MRSFRGVGLFLGVVFVGAGATHCVGGDDSSIVDGGKDTSTVDVGNDTGSVAGPVAKPRQTRTMILDSGHGLSRGAHLTGKIQ